MKPYYQDDYITLYHGDREIDPKTIKQFLETHTARKPR